MGCLSTSALWRVRSDRKFIASAFLAIHGDLRGLQHLQQSDLFRVPRREGRGQLAGHAPLQFRGDCGPDSLKRGEEQPPADAPGHAVVTAQLGRAQIEPSVDVDLLVGRRTLPAVVFRRAGPYGFRRHWLANQRESSSTPLGVINDRS